MRDTVLPNVRARAVNPMRGPSLLEQLGYAYTLRNGLTVLSYQGVMAFARLVGGSKPLAKVPVSEPILHQFEQAVRADLESRRLRRKPMDSKGFTC